MTRPDRTIKLSELPEGFVKRIAAAMIARKGEYTFTDTATGEKVLVTK